MGSHIFIMYKASKNTSTHKLKLFQVLNILKLKVHMVFHASRLVVMAMHSVLWLYYQEKHEGLCYH
jgi:hypothetical protein